MSRILGCFHRFVHDCVYRAHSLIHTPPFLPTSLPLSPTLTGALSPLAHSIPLSHSHPSIPSLCSLPHLSQCFLLLPPFLLSLIPSVSLHPPISLHLTPTRPQSHTYSKLIFFPSFLGHPPSPHPSLPHLVRPRGLL